MKPTKTAFRSIALLGGGLLAACTSSSDRAEHFFVAPGKYVLYDCAQLAREEKVLIDRERDLARLDARAREGPAGGMIATLTYEPDYHLARGNLIDLRNEQRAKNCATTPAGKPAR